MSDGRVGPRAVTRVGMSAPDIGDAELDAVADVLRSGRLSMGPWTAEFEAGARARAGRKHAVAVSNGTAGLHIAVRALEIGEGDVVLTTSFSFAASTNCFLYERAVPAFVDIDPVTFNLDPTALLEVGRTARGAGRRVAAILPVHVFGQPCDMDPVRDVADELGVPIIEDACEAIGAEYKGRPAGSLGDASVFAFYPNKQMTTGEGGVIVTDSDRVAAIARSLRNQGRGDGDEWLLHMRLGFNYRIDEMSAALGVVQFRRLDELLAARAAVADAYTRELADVDGVEPPWVAPTTTRMSWFVYVVKLSTGIDRDRVVGALRQRGIDTRPYFLPIHTQPYIRELLGDLSGSLPVTEDLGRRTLALPFHGRLAHEHVTYVVHELREAIRAA